MNFIVTSTAFKHEQIIPTRFTCDGKDYSPEFKFENAPQGTMSFAIIMDDPDAPPGTWVHWVLYDLPASTTVLPEGVSKAQKLDAGTRQGAGWGVESFSRIGYYKVGK